MLSVLILKPVYKQLKAETLLQEKHPNTTNEETMNSIDQGSEGSHNIQLAENVTKNTHSIENIEKENAQSTANTENDHGREND